MIEYNTSLQINEFYFFKLSEKFVGKKQNYKVFFC